MSPILSVCSDYCSVAESCPTLWDPRDCSMPGFPVLHYQIIYIIRLSKYFAQHALLTSDSKLASFLALVSLGTPWTLDRASALKIPVILCVLTKKGGWRFECVNVRLVDRSKNVNLWIDECLQLSPHLQAVFLINSIISRRKCSSLREKIFLKRHLCDLLLTLPRIYTYQLKYPFRENAGWEMGVRKFPLDDGFLLTKNLMHWSKKDLPGRPCRDV